MTATAICPASSAQDGTRLIPFAALKDASSAKGEFEIEAAENNTLNFRAAGNLRSVVSLDVAEFPPVPAIPENARTLTFAAGKFLAALESVASAISTDAARYILNGVCLDIAADGARLIATDGRRMHLAAVPEVSNDPATLAKIAAAESERLQAHAALDAAHHELAETEKTSPPQFVLVGNLPGFPGREFYEKSASEAVKLAESRVRACQHAATVADETLQALKTAAQILLPAKAVKTLLAMPLDHASELPLHITAWLTPDKDAMPYAHIAAGDYALTTKQIQGNFPNYRQVIPQDVLCSVTLPADELRAAIAQVEPICTDKANSVKVHISKNLLTVTAKSELGDARAAVAVDYHDKEMAIAFNPRYLLEMLADSQVLADKISAHFIDELSPGVFTNAANWRAVIMPMRLS